MNKFNILAGVVGIIATFTGYLFLSNQVEEVISVGTELPQAVALFETSLAAPITSTADTMTLTSNSVRGGGSLSGYNCFTIDEGSAQAEFVCGTVATTTVSGLSRGISPLDGTTEDSDLKFSHRRGASVKITDFPILQLLRNQNNGSSTFNNTLSYNSAVTISTSSNQIPYAAWVQAAITGQSVLTTTNQSVAGNKTFTGSTALSGTNTLATTSITILTLTSGTVATTPSGNTDIANKAYVDGVAIAGASDANETTKGIVEEATTAELLAGTATGTTGAQLFIPPDKLLTFLRGAVETTASTTYSLTTTAGQRVVVWAKGQTGQGTINLAYNGVTKDTVTSSDGGDSFHATFPFSLFYTEIPGAGTANITVSGGANVVIMVLKI